jgi:hypothetical protein
VILSSVKKCLHCVLMFVSDVQMNVPKMILSIANNAAIFVENAQQHAESKRIMKKIKTIWKNYNLSIVLLFLFLVSWGGQLISQYYKVYNEQLEKGLPFEWSTFWPEFFSATFENWQSEFLQLLTFVVLTAFLIHKNSAESRDGTDRIERKLDEILKKLK